MCTRRKAEVRIDSWLRAFPGMAMSNVSKIGLWLLLVTSCVALPKRKLSDVITHYEQVNYDVEHSHLKHQHFSKQWENRQEGGMDHFVLSIHAFGREFRMELHVDEKIFASNVQFLGGNGEPFEVDQAEYLVGHIIGDKNSYVHGSVLNGRFRGVIRAHDEKYMVESSLAHFEKDQPFHSVMYRDSDVLHHKVMKNGSCSGQPSTSHPMYENIKEQVEAQIKAPGKSRQRRQTNLEKVECRINIGGDHTFANHIRIVEALPADASNRIRAAVGQALALFVHEANVIFSKTTFLPGSQAAEGVLTAIQTVRVYVNVEEMRTFRPGTALTDSLLSAEAVLTDWSTFNWNDNCLSYLFSHRDYTDGVLGLAYVSGICLQQYKETTRNTGIVTTLNSGRTVPSLTTFLVFTHELGHNFGSRHDTTATCQPSDSDGGKYIMFPTATNGMLRNNRLFSPCSRSSIAQQLVMKAFVPDSRSRCFKTRSNGEICGNRVKEGNEQCDCGARDQCVSMPNCCQAGNCKLRANASCSIQDGPCCTNNCGFIPSSMRTVCSEPHECRVGIEMCNGLSATCPRAASKPDGMVCNRGRYTCLGGECNSSLCVRANLQPCFCEKPNDCAVCCKKADRTCVPLSTISNVNMTGLNLMLAPGSPCQDYSGYCNFLNFCRRINDTGLLFQLTSALFSLDSFQSAWDWAQQNWYYVLLGFGGIVLMFALIIHFGAKKTPRTVPVRVPKARPQKKTDDIHLVSVSEDPSTKREH